MIVRFDFFLAHSSADAEAADLMFNALESLGVNCFLDSKSLELGDDWDIAIPEAQRDSWATIVFISASCDRAFYQREEIAHAISLARQSGVHRVIPVFIDEISPESIPYGLRTKHGLNVRRGDDFRDAAAKLARSRRRELTPTTSLRYDVDICICLDMSNSSQWLLALMKRQLLTLGHDVVTLMAQVGKAVDRLRVRVITFGPPGEPIESTPMIDLPAGAALLYERALSLQLRGGGPPESTGLAALEVAINSDWTGGGDLRRHIILIITDREAVPAQDDDRLYNQWALMEFRSKRIVMLAPDSSHWNGLVESFENLIHMPIDGRNPASITQEDIIELVVYSV